jgi:hypothetical protein
MGDMSTGNYDSNSDFTVDAADYAANAGQLGGVAASVYLQRTSADRPGVTKLYRIDSDSGYYVRHYWTGTHWYLQGYNSSDVFHAGCRVEYANVAPWSGISGKPSTYTPSAHTHPGTDITSAVASATNADTLDTYHYSSFLRRDVNDTKNGYMACLGGISVGSNTVAPSAGHVWFGGSVLRIYNNGSDALRIYNSSYGYVDIAANASSQAYFATGENIFLFNKAVYSSAAVVGYGDVVASYQGSTANSMYLTKHSGDGHIYLNGVSGGAIRFHYYGGATKTTHIHNGTSAYGNIHADVFVDESTRASKHNIRPLTSHLFNEALDLISLMSPVAFEKVNTGNKTRIGFIAEDLYHVLPHVVYLDPETQQPAGIAYGQIVPLLVLAIQEIKEKING